MSAAQYNALKIWSGHASAFALNTKDGVGIKQGTFNSLGKRGWLEFTGTGFKMTREGREDLSRFENVDVFKKNREDVRRMQYGSWWRGVSDALANFTIQPSPKPEKKKVHVMRKRKVA